jgi:protein grpE
MQDKDIKDEVLEEDINKEEVKEEEHEHEHEHKHGGHTCCGKHGHKQKL